MSERRTSHAQADPGPPCTHAAVAGTPARAFLLGVGTLLLGAALFARPTPWGDGSEYQLMAESLLRHGTPELRSGDVASLAARERRFDTGVDAGVASLSYYEARGGGWYCYHFWGYSLLGVPLKGLLRLAGANDLRALPLLNVLIFLFALQQVLGAARLPARAAWCVAALAAVSPAVWFVLWIHPEAFCFACVLLALAWTHAGHRFRPVVAASLAAMQNPPIVWLVLPLALRALAVPWPPTPRRLARTALAVFPAAWPMLFSLWKFGTPSLLAQQATDVALASWERVRELFFDLNLGLLPYLPIPLALALAGLALGPYTRRRVALTATGVTVVLAMAFSATVTVNWNHGTAGPSRYTVWLLPLVLWPAAWTCACLLAHPRRAVRTFGALVLASALVSQAALVVGRGGLAQGDDSGRHSWAARLVLHHAPSWYNPPPEIFLARTLGGSVEGERTQAVYRDASGCRKAWLRRKDAGWLRAQCGTLPPQAAAFFGRGERHKEWGYVDF